eukprot:27882_1
MWTPYLQNVPSLFPSNAATLHLQFLYNHEDKPVVSLPFPKLINMNSCVISVTKTNTTQWRCKLINQLGVVQKSYDVFGNVSDELQYPWRIELVTFMRAIDLKPLRFLSEIHNSSDSDVTKLHSNSLLWTNQQTVQPTKLQATSEAVLLPVIETKRYLFGVTVRETYPGHGRRYNNYNLILYVVRDNRIVGQLQRNTELSCNQLLQIDVTNNGNI